MRLVFDTLGVFRLPRLAALAAAAAVGIAAGAASASTTFTVTQQNSSIFYQSGGHDVAKNVTIYDTSLPHYSGYYGSESGTAGAFALNGNISGTGAVDFTAFCLDIFDQMQKPDWKYSVTDAPFSPGQTLSSLQQNDISYLFNTAFSTLNLSNSTQSAGFQIALWEIVNEDVTTAGVNPVFNVNSGTFKVSANSSVTGFANNLLSALSGKSSVSYTKTYNVIYLQNEDTRTCSWQYGRLHCSGGPSQNLVTISAVPVPAAGVLLLTAFGGFGFVGRRKRRKAG